MNWWWYYYSDGGNSNQWESSLVVWISWRLNTITFLPYCKITALPLIWCSVLWCFFFWVFIRCSFTGNWHEVCVDSHVSTVGIRAANIRNNMEKNRNPELLRTFLASFPMPRYSRPIRTPIPMWEEILRWVSTCSTNENTDALLVVSLGRSCWRCPAGVAVVSHRVSEDAEESPSEQDGELGHAAGREAVTTFRRRTLLRNTASQGVEQHDGEL